MKEGVAQNMATTMDFGIRANPDLAKGLGVPFEPHAGPAPTEPAEPAGPAPTEPAEPTAPAAPAAPPAPAVSLCNWPHLGAADPALRIVEVSNSSVDSLELLDDDESPVRPPRPGMPSPPRALAAALEAAASSEAEAQGSEEEEELGFASGDDGGSEPWGANDSGSLEPDVQLGCGLFGW